MKMSPSESPIDATEASFGFTCNLVSSPHQIIVTTDILVLDLLAGEAFNAGEVLYVCLLDYTCTGPAMWTLSGCQSLQ